MKFKWIICTIALLWLGVSFTARAESRRESYCQAQRSLQQLHLYAGVLTCQADEATRNRAREVPKTPRSHPKRHDRPDHRAKAAIRG